jgi:acyl-coenzyme A synthetase/AMP-(fatty) acid ligase
MINAYGPTESTVCTTMTDALSGTGNPSIGSPIVNSRVYILDGNLEPAPVGVAGELYIAGVGLARGYLNRPSLTSSHFVADPHGLIAGCRMYRTGDVARWNADGTLEFVGRVDEQVKVRGFRIELGEIETVLCSQPEIAEAAVVVHENSGSKQIAAYVVPSNGNMPESVELRERLSERLPVYMLPAVFVNIEELPRGPNGKVNRRMLPRIAERPRNSRPAQSQEEVAICALCAEVLAVDSVNVGDDFFALGGDSLGAMRLVSRIVSDFKVPLSLREFYSAGTVEGVARLVQAMQFTAMQNGKAAVTAEIFEEEEI